VEFAGKKGKKAQRVAYSWADVVGGGIHFEKDGGGYGVTSVMRKEGLGGARNRLKTQRKDWGGAGNTGKLREIVLES